jgi:hypothetical protein
VAKVKASDTVNRQRKIDTVESIEQIHLDSEFVLLVDRESLDDREVVLHEAWTSKSVSRRLSLTTNCAASTSGLIGRIG